MPFPRPLSQLVAEELRGHVLLDRLAEADIWRLWPEVVGPAVARRSQPLRIINGTLTVAVSSSAWLQELTFLRDMIKEKLNRQIGRELVKEIVLRSGKVSPPPRDEAPPPASRPLSPEEMHRIEETAAAIPDEETRNAFADLMKASLAHERRSPK